MRARSSRARSSAAALLALHLPACPLEQGVAPYPRDDVATTREDEPIVIDLLANDHGAHELTRIATWPKLGTIVARRDGTVHYTPNPDVSGEDAFSYVVENEHGSAVARVTVHIEGDDDDFGPPIVLFRDQFVLEPFAADLNLDDQADLVLKAGNSTRALLGDGEAFREAAAWGEGCCGRPAPRVVDLDGDGDGDIVRFDERGGLTIHLVEAEGDGLTTEDHAIVYAGSNAIPIEDLSPTFRPVPEKVVAGDFDQDGAMDLAVSLDVDFVVLHSDVSSGVPAHSRVVVQDRILAMASGDVTGDGFTDLVLAQGSGTVLDIVQLQDGEVSFARIAWPAPRTSSVTHLLAAQLDDDARDELVLIDGEAITVVDVLVDGDGVSAETIMIESDLHIATLADVVGDPRLDLVGVRWSPYVIEIWEATRDEDEAFSRRGDFRAGGVLGLLTGSPAVLPSDDGDRILIGRFNDEQKQYELVAFTSADGGRRK